MKLVACGHWCPSEKINKLSVDEHNNMLYVSNKYVIDYYTKLGLDQTDFIFKELDNAQYEVWITNLKKYEKLWPSTT